MERVFVYGTLRRGDCRDLGLRSVGTRFVGAGSVRGELFDLGEYPGVRLGGEGTVVGEVFEVPEATMAELDAMEGDEYVRVREAVLQIDETAKECWVYEVIESVAAGCPGIASGDWFAR